MSSESCPQKAKVGSPGEILDFFGKNIGFSLLPVLRFICKFVKKYPMLTIHLAYPRSGEPTPYITKEGEKTNVKADAVRSQSIAKLKLLAKRFNLQNHEYTIGKL